MSSRFSFLDGKDDEYLMSHGLLPMDETDTQLQQELMDLAVSFSLIWKDRDDAPKVIKWDSKFEKYLEHRAALIDHGGRENFAPWKIYEDMGLQYAGGFGLNQGAIGTCLPYDTKIMTPNGSIPIGELDGHIIDLISRDAQTGKPCLRQGRVYKTDIKEIVEIGVSKNDTELGCGYRVEKYERQDGSISTWKTPRKSRCKTHRVFRLSADHKVMMKSGEMIEAGRLAEGMRLMTAQASISNRGYARIQIPSGKKNIACKGIDLHTLYSTGTGRVAHHVNHDRLDNRRENIELLTVGQHKSQHYRDRDEAYRGVGSQEMSRMGNAKRRINERKKLLDLFWSLTTEAGSDTQKDVYTTYRLRFENECRSRHDSKKTKKSQDRAYEYGHKRLDSLKRQIARYFGSYKMWCYVASGLNGRVTYVKAVGYAQCYDIEVLIDEPDDSRLFTNHNFFICSEGGGRYDAGLLCVKNCCMAAHRNAGTCSDLVHAKLLGVKPIELNCSIPYALGRGSGRLAWGSGLNLSPMSNYAAREGNYRVADVGPYNIRGDGVTEANRQKFGANARKHQSIICHLPNLSFDTFYFIARAGLACNFGASSWFGGGTTDGNGMRIGTGRSTGDHAMMLAGFAISINNTSYLWWGNSHGGRYGSGTRIKNPPSGCFATKSNWGTFAIKTGYGIPYIGLSELGNLRLE